MKNITSKVNLTRTFTFISFKCFSGPIPESISNFGLPITPALTMTPLLAVILEVLPNFVNCIPVAFFELIKTYQNI